MTNLLSSIGLIGLLAVVGWTIAGFFVVMGIFGSKNSERRRESDVLADGLIQRLKETVEQQSKDIAELQTQMVNQQAELNHVKGRNAVLEDLFKGRDPSMQQFLSDAPTLMEIARENNGLAKEMGNGLSKLEGTLARFIDTLQPALIHAELAKQ